MKYALKIAYDGAGFFGFQRQSAHKTVQGELEGYLSSFFAQEITTVAAGRTDSGVHGNGQVVAFESEQVKDLGRLCHSLNSMARVPLAVREAVCLEDDDPFHPRYSALSRTYSYYLVDRCTPRESILWKHCAWCLAGELQPDSLRQPLAGLIGEHDFTTFSYKSADLPSRVRQLFELELSPEPSCSLLGSQGARLWRLQVRANGFLRRMVRLLTAGLVEVGLGLRESDDLLQRLEARKAELAPHPAPPQGLYLDEVEYQPDPFLELAGTSRHHRATERSRLRVKR